MSTILAQPVVSPLGSTILKVLLYADVFNHPLTQEEIYTRCSIKIHSSEQFSQELNWLVEEGYLFRMDNFYSIHNKPELAEKRLKSNQLADKYMHTARFISRHIGSFPYVRAVFLSGSLSKGCMDADSDIDYFVVTQPGRLWITKTILYIFRKMMPFSLRKKYFCLNYFIDSAHLEIEEKNHFTATEIITVIPTYGAQEYLDFYQSNPWISEHYPNSLARDINQVPVVKSKFHKKILERLLNGTIGDRLEKYLCHYLSARHQKKFVDFKPEDREVAIKTKDYVAKIHGKHHQKRVLDTFESRVSQYEQQYHVNLTLSHG
jgi:hypothetical protein